MQLTMPAKGKEGAKNYREKKLYSFSTKQAEALAFDFFGHLEEAQDYLGKQAKQIMTSLVNLELFKQKKDGSYTRTRLGTEVAERLAERV